MCVRKTELLIDIFDELFRFASLFHTARDLNQLMPLRNAREHTSPNKLIETTKVKWLVRKIVSSFQNVKNTFYFAFLKF